MTIEKNELDKILQQAKESADLASNASDLMSYLLEKMFFTDEYWEWYESLDEYWLNDEDAPESPLDPEVRTLFDLHSIISYMSDCANYLTSDAITLLNGGIVERQDDETIEDFQNDINENRTKFVFTRATVTGEMAFIYNPKIIEEETRL